MKRGGHLQLSSTSSRTRVVFAHISVSSFPPAGPNTRCESACVSSWPIASSPCRIESPVAAFTLSTTAGSW